jgi:hypothetical protein
MSDPLIRLLIVVGVALVAGIVVMALRKRAAGGEVRLDQDLLGPGTYLFTSASCAGCSPARERLVGTVGSGGFREIAWESEPGVFEELAIAAVPAILIVDDAQRSTLYPGDGDAVEALNP